MYKQTLEKFDDSRGCLYPLEREDYIESFSVFKALNENFINRS